MKGLKRVEKMQINDVFKFILWHDINDSYSTDVCEQRQGKTRSRNHNGGP